MVISRRAFCLGLGISFLLPRLVFAESLGPSCVKAISSKLEAMPAGPALLNSYLVETGADESDFDLTQSNAAYVYDNALAGLLLIAAGFKSEAKRIGDALEIAQNHDRFYTDGRLRNAYQSGATGAPARLPGWWNSKEKRWNEDAYHVGSQTGPLAWAILLWEALGMKDPAIRAAKWISNELRAKKGYYGGYYGFEPEPQKLLWQSTEQNVDLFVAFSDLA